MDAREGYLHMELFDRATAPKRADTWFVYALVDSRKMEDVRYIGITNDPRRRLLQHYRTSAEPNTRKSRWIAKVVRDGGDVLMQILAGDLTHDAAKSLEIATINLHRGRALTNLTDGGDGTSGFIPGALSRAKMSYARRLRTTGAETRQRMSAAGSGKKKDAEHAAKCALAVRLRGPQSGLHKGVSFHGRSGKWVVNIRLDGRPKHMGYFDTPELAARAYDKAAYAAWGNDCYLNFPADMAA